MSSKNSASRKNRSYLKVLVLLVFVSLLSFSYFSMFNPFSNLNLFGEDVGIFTTKPAPDSDPTSSIRLNLNFSSNRNSVNAGESVTFNLNVGNITEETDTRRAITGVNNVQLLVLSYKIPNSLDISGEFPKSLNVDADFAQAYVEEKDNFKRLVIFAGSSDNNLFSLAENQNILSFNAAVSGNAPDGQTISVEPEFTGDTPDILNVNEESLLVRDSLSSVALQVSNVDPVVNITQPEHGQVYNEPDRITLFINTNVGNANIESIAVGEMLSGNFNELGFASVSRNRSVWTFSLADNELEYKDYFFKALLRTIDGQEIESDTVKVVSNAVPTGSISYPDAETGFEFPHPANNLNFSVEAEDPGENGNITLVEYFDQNDQKLGESTEPSNFDILWDAPSPGEYEVYARITDNYSASSTTNPVGFTVYEREQEEPAPPSVQYPEEMAFSSPNNNSFYTIINDISLEVNTSDNSRVSRVEFLMGDKVIGTADQAPFSVEWRPDLGGNYILGARVYAQNDDQGRMIDQTVRVTVLDGDIDEFAGTDVRDVLHLLNALFGEVEPTDEMDLNRDGGVDVRDALIILNIISN